MAPPIPADEGYVFDQDKTLKYNLHDRTAGLLNALTSKPLRTLIQEQLLSRPFVLDQDGQNKELTQALQTAARRESLTHTDLRSKFTASLPPPQVLTSSSFKFFKNMKPQVKIEYSNLAVLGFRHGVRVEKSAGPKIVEALVGVAEGIQAGAKGLLDGLLGTEGDKAAAQHFAKITTGQWKELAEEMRVMREKIEALEASNKRHADQLKRHSDTFVQMGMSGQNTYAPPHMGMLPLLAH